MATVDDESTPESLYARLLGEAWKELPAVLRRFHSADRAIDAHGRFTVRRKVGLIPRIACWLARLPAQGEDLPARVSIVPTPDGEDIRRTFGRSVFVSQYREASGGLLAERCGLVEFYYRVGVESGALVFQHVRTRLCLGGMRLSLPLWLSPTAQARTCVGQDQEGGIQVSVRASLPLLGQVIEYKGFVEPGPELD